MVHNIKKLCYINFREIAGLTFEVYITILLLGFNKTMTKSLTNVNL